MLARLVFSWELQNPRPFHDEPQSLRTHEIEAKPSDGKSTSTQLRNLMQVLLVRIVLQRLLTVNSVWPPTQAECVESIPVIVEQHSFIVRLLTRQWQYSKARIWHVKDPQHIANRPAHREHTHPQVVYAEWHALSITICLPMRC